MSQHDLDILELGLHVKVEIWSENSSPVGARLAIRRRCFEATEPYWLAKKYGVKWWHEVEMKEREEGDDRLRSVDESLDRGSEHPEPGA